MRLLDDLRAYVECKVKEMLSWSEALRREPFPEEPLTFVVEAVVTQSWHFPNSWDRLVEALRERSYGKWRASTECQRTVERRPSHVEAKPLVGLDDLLCVRETLLHLYEETGKEAWRRKAEAIEALKERLESAGSLRAWVSELHEAILGGFLRRGGRGPECLEGVKGIGAKGACDIVRTLGHFDVAPIDVHERRFLLRTGIVCRYGPASFDPRDKMSYLEALRNFCREELSGEEVLGIDLGEAPGIADVAIWYFCSERGRNVCGNIPKCDEKRCPLRDRCLYYFLTHAWRG